MGTDHIEKYFKKIMTTELKGKKVAILAAEGFEESELKEPKKALESAGAETEIVSINKEAIRSWRDNQWGEAIQVDTVVEEANPDHYDALMIPGGLKNPDVLRMNADAVEFVRQFAVSGKPIGAICHGPWILVEADVVKGRTLTSYPSIKTDIKNANGNWVDKEVVVDKGIVTSRTPKDIPAFTLKLVEEIREGVHENRQDII